MVRVRVLYFASAREALDGLAEEMLEVVGKDGSDETSMADVVAELKRRHGEALEELLYVCGFALNEQYTAGSLESVALAEGDTVALIPPISGG